MARAASKRELERCDDAWTLPKSKQTHPGNLLHLLNHEAGHKVGA